MSSKESRKEPPTSEENDTNEDDASNEEESSSGSEISEGRNPSKGTKGKRPRQRSGKQPRRHLPPGALQRESSKKVEKVKMDRQASKLRRQSKVNEPERFDPSNSLTQRQSNVTDYKSKDVSNIQDFRQFSMELKDMPTNVGRSRGIFPFRFDDLENKSCSVCKMPFDTGEKFNHDNNYARICGICNDREPSPVNKKKLREYVDGKSAGNLWSCLVCSNALGVCNHSFGQYRICPACITDKKCPCQTCCNLKTAQRRRLCTLFEKSNTDQMQYDFIDSDFSHNQQILLFLRRKELPFEMNQILSDFAMSNTVRDASYPALSANHCNLTVKNLLEFGTMKCFDLRRKDHETKFKWVPNTGKKRLLRAYVISYAEELIRNDCTISIPHSDNLESFKENFNDAIVKSRELEKGIFSFRFVQFFFDRIKGSKGNDWTSYVMNMETKEVSYFDRSNQFSKQIVIITNEILRSEWSNYVGNNKDNEDFQPFTLNDYVQFKLPIFSEDEKYRWDTGIASIIHSWTMTAPDLFGSKDNFDADSLSCLNTFELMDERTVERFRQLILFWIIGNNMNMHLFIDMRDKVRLPR